MPSATPPSTPPPLNLSASAATLLGQAMSRALRAGSVHSVATEVVNGLHVRFDDHDGATAGSQTITIQGQPAEVRVVGSDTYFIGSAPVLAGFFGTTPAAAIQDAGRWIHLTPRVRGYQSVTVNVTLPSTLHLIALTGALKKLPVTTKNGVQVVGVEGELARQDQVKGGGTGTLWFATGGSQLPVEFDIHAKKLSSVTRFSDWGAPVTVSRPAASVDGSNAFAAQGGSGPGVSV